MPHIQVLDRQVANLIAAGEVVERPASVVKELVENSIDAAASAVSVSTERGGMGVIRVSDDGCGIAPEQLTTAFLRHATSKVRTAADLTEINTLGFRGEALAAICAVSRVEIRTREQNRDIGAALRVEGGIAGKVEEVGAPIGTTVIVRDIFFNTPARLKFMRKDSAESAAIASLMQHLSLSHPEISFKFIREGVNVLHTPGDGKLESAIYAALGRDFATSLLPIESGGKEIKVKGFITSPFKCRGSRSMQIFFVNGRFIKSQLLTAALEESYRNQVMKGKFPGCVLFITLPVTAVDVNVHPAKTQVKFASERKVFDILYHTAIDALAHYNSPISATPEPKLIAPSRQDFFQSMNAKNFPAQQNNNSQEDRQTIKVIDIKPRRTFSENRRAVSVDIAPPTMPKLSPVSLSSHQKEQTTKQTLLSSVPAHENEEEKESPWRIAGELFRTYIVCESNNGNIFFIDKHAAHERINFDRLKLSQEPPMRQALLQPIAAELEQEDNALLLENLSFLEEFGFSCEDFGNGTILIREIPSDIDAADAIATLEEFAANLRTGRNVAERREKLLETIACKAAIKGGWKSDERELRVLVDKVQSGEVRFCPHGRPVVVKLTKYEIEKLFGRA